MAEEARIGYIGVDVLNNATVCNEATGLLRAGLPLEIVSVYPYASATYYQDESLSDLRRQLRSIYPLGAVRTAGALMAAPFLFGLRFWSMLAKACFGPAEGMRQRLTILYQILPAVVLARGWRFRGIRHIHAHWAHTATAVAMHTAELLGVGFSFTGHANDLFVHRVGLKAKIRRARFVVCISEYHRRFYLDLGADPSRLPVVYCGIDVGRLFMLSNDAAEAVPPRIVSVGRLVEKKGFVHLIAACAILKAEGFDFECVIAGSGPEQSLLERKIAEQGLEGVVRLTGRTLLQEDLPALVASSRVFALPCVRDSDGDMDGLPQVLIEALACGVPVVSTRLVGIPDLVRDGQNGVLVEPGDVAGLATALAGLISRPEIASKLGESGRGWALEHFGREDAIRRLGSLFLWAARTPGSSAPEGVPCPPAPGSGDAYQGRVAIAESVG